MTATFEPGYKGSQRTFEMVLKQIQERWPDKPELAEGYDPTTNVLPYRSWLAQNRVVRKGEKALKSFTFVEGKDKRTGNERKYHKPVFLFHLIQTEPLN